MIDDIPLDFGRFLTGYGCGTLSYVVPVFIAEISPRKLRGALATLNQLFLVIGLASMFLIGAVVNWRALALTGVVPCVILFFGTWFIPESPRWLEMVGRHRDFEIALQKLRGPNANIAREADEIKEYLATIAHLPKTTLLDLIDKKNIRFVIVRISNSNNHASRVGVGLMFFQQFVGINGVIFYAQQIFTTHRFCTGLGVPGASPTLGSILYSIEQVILTALGATLLIDRLGRRPLLLVWFLLPFSRKQRIPIWIIRSDHIKASAVGMLIGCLLIGNSFLLKAHGLALDIIPALAVSGVLVYIGSFSIGMGAIPWVIMSEIFPINLKGTAGGLVTVVNWLSSWFVSLTFNFLMIWSPHGAFYVYGGVCVLAIIFIAKLVPETKGKTLEEIQAMMIMEKGLLLVNKEEKRGSSETTITPLLIFTTFIIVSASYSFGIALGFTAGTMSSIMEDLDLSIAQFSVFGSLLTFGGMIGAIFSATIADAFGRKMTLWVAEAFFISGWLAIAQAKNIIWLDFGRFFVGTGVGLASYVVPVYIAEITPKNVRGTFTFSNQLLQNCGIATAYYIGNFVSWRTIALIGIIPCLIQFLGLFFIPESPRWLAKENRDEECEVVLQNLRGKEADIVKETREIMISVDATANISMQSLFKRKYARQLIIGVGVMLLQQLCGSSGISYYAGSIFDLAGFPSQTGMTVLSMVVVPKAILGLIIVDRWGRRPLLMASAFGLCLSCISLALAFGFKGVPGIVNFTPTMAFIGILTYVMMFAAGLGALPWIIMSEIFPMDMKVVAGSLVTITNWFTGWIVSYCFNFMLIWSPTGTFIIFAIMSGLTVVFAWCLVPETRGLTLEEIQFPRES
ncbi:LOW QUALITY PROTEIN: hypothetical protein HID58_003791 [Brassica napus]|uniref:Major facilitator superfamily (MFS) profile domain-containing protein n=1 Tax=Brassica napus TaxID=3708 RepID=A0ABQ8ERG9_BRANA|nr:LOW QUALITY PROTEIN: hypothetical protein HID58_003791 [Brassica napus]